MSIYTHFIVTVERVVRHLVAEQAGVVARLPRHEDAVRLDVLDGELHHEWHAAELLRLEFQEHPPSQFRRLLAAETARFRYDELLMIPQPLPQLLRFTAAV